MKASPAVALAILLTSLPVAAQISLGTAEMEGPNANGWTAPAAGSLPNICPVALRARHLADGGMAQTAMRHPAGHGQALHLIFTSPDARTLASASLRVRGWTAEGHLQPTWSNGAHAVRNLQVPLTAGAGRTASADVWVPGLTAVDSVDLVAATYADGSTWTAMEDARCRVMPELLMLVSQP